MTARRSSRNGMGGPVRGGLVLVVASMMLIGCATVGPDRDGTTPGRVATVVDLETGAVLGAANDLLRRERRQQQLLLDSRQALMPAEVDDYLTAQATALRRLLDATPATLQRRDRTLQVVLPADDVFSQGDDLRPAYHRLLGDVVGAMEGRSGHFVEIAAHVAGHGAASVNQRLSEDRARAMGHRMVEAGFPATRLLIAAYGADDPGAGEGRSANRMELVIVPLVRMD